MHADRTRERRSAVRVCLVGLIAGGHSGVPRYAAKLIESMDLSARDFPSLELVLLTTPEGREASGVERMETVVTRSRGRHANAGPGRLVLEHLQARRARADLLHFFDITGPVLAPHRPFVATVHDTSALRGFRRVKNSYKQRLYPWAMRRATAAVAVSQAAKDDIVAALGVDAEKIHVVHSGPGFAPGSVDAVGDDDREPTLLYVGNVGLNKNVPILVEAFDRADLDARLAIVGRPSDGFADVEAAIGRARSRSRIDLVTDASDADIDALYRTATALFLPSTYEGFGFTPLEAMARGCPVVESDIPALREISGAGALLVRPDDLDGWSEAMRQVFRDRAVRDDLRRRGLQTVAGYSWDKTAREVLQLFAEVSV